MLQPVLLRVLLAGLAWPSAAWQQPARVQLRTTPIPQRAARRSLANAELVEQLDTVRKLRPSTQSAEVQATLWEAAGLNPRYKVSGGKSGEPSFTRLLSHSDWAQYTGRPPMLRWWCIFTTWRFSTILNALWPISLTAAIWAYIVTSLPARFLPRTSPVPLSLFGQALGLLLVFRTNNTYQRLAEARLLWGRAVYLCREVAQSCATTLYYGRAPPERKAALDCSRYLIAFAWELNAKLTGPDQVRTAYRSDEVLAALLPEAEAEWIARQSLRPLQLLGFIRRELLVQYRAGNLPRHLHWKLEEDVKELDLIVGGCERLFSSPLPPTMSRHVVRCLMLWLVGLPFVLVGTMSPLATALWLFITSYIFVGIEEVGVQVEQPFEIVPMTALCNAIMVSMEELFIEPPPKGGE